VQDTSAGVVQHARDGDRWTLETALIARGDLGRAWNVPVVTRDRDTDPRKYPTAAPPDVPQRMPWRSAVAGAVSLGTPMGTGLLNRLLGETIFGLEIVMALTVISVAMFGSPILSERAFRLLRWFGNRPEPPAPSRF
jgi:hypothetical protein